MHDPRKPRPLKPRTLQVLVADSNNFSRGLIGEILRSLNVTNISSARSEEMADAFLIDRPVDVILLSWEEGDSFNGLSFVRKLRRLEDDRLRRLPVIFITAGLTRQMVINGRDAGVDEFLAKPISPLAMRQRLEMVVETPRPFIDCSVYLGPCRRQEPGRRRRWRRAASASPNAPPWSIRTKSPRRRPSGLHCRNCVSRPASILPR